MQKRPILTQQNVKYLFNMLVSCTKIIRQEKDKLCEPQKKKSKMCEMTLILRCSPWPKITDNRKINTDYTPSYFDPPTHTFN